MFFDKRYASTEMVNPDFVMLSKAYGIPTQRIAERNDLKEALETMLAAKGPYVLEIMIEKEANVFPMIEPGASVSEVTLEYKKTK